MKIINVPSFKQKSRFDCGACALASIFAHYGEDVFEEDIIEIAETKDITGTPITGMLKAIKHFGFDGSLKVLNIDDLKYFIDKNILVVIRLQAWPLKKVLDWTNENCCGHYVIVIGYDSKKIYFEDPWILKKSFLTYKELLERWHDIDVDNLEYRNVGIVISEKEKRVCPKFIHMD